jgi:agmatine deiminase
MIRVLSFFEKVNLVVNDQPTEYNVVARLKSAGANLGRISFFHIPTVDVWMRDYGPTFVTRAHRENPLACNDWVFNGWGAKYTAYENDDCVAKEIAARLGIPAFIHSVVLEGGSIEVNGCGTCLTTEQCLLNKNRNPEMSRWDIEQVLKNSLGVTHVIWLGEGIAGDDTDGHIDDIGRFVDPSTVVCAVEGNSQSENYAALRDNYERLQRATDQDGNRLSIVPLPSPAPLSYGGSRLPASYANFYIANGVVLVPLFDDSSDDKALAILKELFSGREVMGLPCRAIVAGLGAIHCVTQQQPKVMASWA